MSDLPPKFTEDGSSISLAWWARLHALNALGEYGEDCAACGETWLFYCDMRDENGVEKALAEQGKPVGDKWVCEYCLATYHRVQRVLNQ